MEKNIQKGEGVMKMKKMVLLFIVFAFIGMLSFGATITIQDPTANNNIKGKYLITWESSLDVKYVTIKYRTSNAAADSIIVGKANNVGYYEWDTKNLDSDGKNGEVAITIEGYNSLDDADPIQTAVSLGNTLKNYEPKILYPSTDSKIANDQIVTFYVENGKMLGTGDERITLLLNDVDVTSFIKKKEKINDSVFKYTLDTIAATGSVVGGNGAKGMVVKVAGASINDSERKNVSKNIYVQNVYLTIPTGALSDVQDLNWKNNDNVGYNANVYYKIGEAGAWSETPVATYTFTTGDTTKAINTNVLPQSNAETLDEGIADVYLKLVVEQTTTGQNKGFIAWTTTQAFAVNHRPVVDQTSIKLYRWTGTAKEIMSDSAKIGNTLIVEWSAVDPDNIAGMQFMIKEGEGNILNGDFANYTETANIDTEIPVEGVYRKTGTDTYYYVFNSNKLVTGSYNFSIIVRDKDIPDTTAKTYEYPSAVKQKESITVDHMPVVSNVKIEESVAGILSGNKDNTKTIYFEVKQNDGIDITYDEKISYNIEYTTNGGISWRTFYDFNEGFRKVSTTTSGSLASLVRDTTTTSYQVGVKVRYTITPNEIIEVTSSNVKFRVTAKYTSGIEAADTCIAVESTSAYKTVHSPVISTWDMTSTGSSIKAGADANGWLYKTAVINWTVTDPDADAISLKIEYSRDEAFSEPVLITTIADAIATQDYTWDTSALADGNYYIRITAIDDSGAQTETRGNHGNYTKAESTMKFVVDNATEPTVTVIQPSITQPNKDATLGYADDDGIAGLSTISDASTTKTITFKIKNNDLRTYAVGDIAYTITLKTTEAVISVINSTKKNTSTIAYNQEITETYVWSVPSSLADRNDYTIEVKAETNNPAFVSADKKVGTAENPNAFTILNKFPYFDNFQDPDADISKFYVKKTGGNLDFQWNVKDPDTLSKDLKYTIYCKPTEDESWNSPRRKMILGGLIGQDTYGWSVRKKGLESDLYYDVVLVATDGENSRYIVQKEAFILKNKPEVTLLTPAQNDKWGGARSISWNIQDPEGMLITSVAIKIKKASDSSVIYSKTFESNTGVTQSSIVFNTQDYDEGSYVAEIMATNEGGFDSLATIKTIERGYTSDRYIHNFVVRHKPSLDEVAYPISGTVLSGTPTFIWRATDPDKDEAHPDGDILTTTIEYAIDDSNEWTLLNTTTLSSLKVDTKRIPDSENVKIRISITDNTTKGGIDVTEVTGLTSKHKPEIIVIEPKEGIVYKKDIRVICDIKDPDQEGIVEQYLYYKDDVKDWTKEGITPNLINGSVSIPDEVLKGIKTETGKFSIKIYAKDKEDKITEKIMEVNLDRSPDVFVLYPLRDMEVKDEMTIRWKASNPNGSQTDINENLKYKIYYSIDGGGTWRTLYDAPFDDATLKVKGAQSEYMYKFNTRTGTAAEKDPKNTKMGIRDSKYAKIKIEATDIKMLYKDSAGKVTGGEVNKKFSTNGETDMFKIANFVPVIRLKQIGKTASGDYTTWYGKRDILWDATSNSGNIEEDKSIDIRIDYAKVNDADMNKEKSWQNLEKRTFNDGIYTWDTEKVPDGNYFLKITGTNTSGEGSDELLTPVKINNSISVNADEFYNYPNPFRSSTNFAYRLPYDVREVRIEIYNSQGQKIETIKDLPNTAGEYKGNPSLSWVAAGYANGVYFARVVAKGYDGKDYIKTTKMAIIK